MLKSLSLKKKKMLPLYNLDLLPASVIGIALYPVTYIVTEMVPCSI